MKISNHCHLIGLLIGMGLLAGCSNSNDDNSNTSAVAVNSEQQNYASTDIQVIFPRDEKNRTVGDFADNISYDIQTNTTDKVHRDSMSCKADDEAIRCVADVDLSKLKSDIYQIAIYNGKGLLGSELFEYIPGVTPVVVISNDSTGYYVLNELMKKTKLRRDDIYNRVRFILGGSKNTSYSLQPTLYDLFVYYQGNVDEDKALAKLAEVIEANQPLQMNKARQVTEIAKPLF